jgi:hypothetical protein
VTSEDWMLMYSIAVAAACFLGWNAEIRRGVRATERARAEADAAGYRRGCLAAVGFMRRPGGGGRRPRKGSRR